MCWQRSHIVVSRMFRLIGFEGITFLSGIERDALGQWSRIPKRKN